MSDRELPVALVTEVFSDDPEGARLRDRLAAAKRQGALVAVLPELPLQPWEPGRKDVGDDEAEERDGPRHRILAGAAREVGIGLVGGIIRAEPATGRRLATALTFDREGRLVDAYDKLHVPEEEGFWERSHYEPGDTLPRVLPGFGLPVAVQICSDANRPMLHHFLAAAGAEAVLVPRATPPESYERWRTVFRGNSITTATYTVSVNRPGSGVAGDSRPAPGGRSLVVAPDGRMILETEEPLAVVVLRHAEVEAARKDYPGYLAVRSDLYSRAWSRIPPRE